MIQIVPQMRILVAIEPVDFRNGIDGLVRICKQKLGSDPFCGWLFVFLNRGRTAVKILTYDQQGFWLCQKRLSTGRFRYWPTAREAAKALEAHELVLMPGFFLCSSRAHGESSPGRRRLCRGRIPTHEQQLLPRLVGGSAAPEHSLPGLQSSSGTSAGLQR
jgi:transposase